MNDILFNKILAYISCENSSLSSLYIPDKLLYIRSSKKYILMKFMGKLIDDTTKDPIDIIDSMLFNYYYWHSNAINDKNDELAKLYDIYIKTLLQLKKYITKEIKR